jgi:iron complex transport system ATP-binding protein
MIPREAARLDHVSLDLGVRRVLRDVSLTLPARGLSAIVGPNGCGKSTITRMLTGFIFPTLGSVEVLGHRIGEVNVHDLRREVKLVQPSMLHEPDFRMTVRDVIATGTFGTVDLHDVPSNDNRARAAELVARFGLQRVADSSFGHCSSGERMRTQLARSLMSRPRLLILDEPTNGLDVPARERLLATIDALLASAEAPAMLLVTHHLEELPTATSQAILMSDGTVRKAGPPGEVLTSAEMSAAFEFPIEVTRRGGRFAAHAANHEAFLSL